MLDDTSRIASSQVTLSWILLEMGIPPALDKAQEIPTYSNTQTIEIAFITV